MKRDRINPLLIPVIALGLAFVVAWFATAAFLIATVIAYGLGGEKWAEALTFLFLPRGPALVFAVVFLATTCLGLFFFVLELCPKATGHDEA